MGQDFQRSGANVEDPTNTAGDPRQRSENPRRSYQNATRTMGIRY